MGVLGAVQIAIGLRALGFFWGIASGLLACYLIHRIHRHGIKVTEGARCGILAGVICALVTASLWLLILVGTLFLGSSGSIAILPPVSLQAVGILVVSLLLMSVLGAMSGGIGGLLGALIFRKRTVPVA